MLANMREKASSWMVKFILGIIVIVFVFFGVEKFRTGKQSRVAMVNGEKISIEAYRLEYQNLVDQIKRQFGGSVSAEFLELFQVQDQALQRLVDRTLLRQEAEKKKLKISNKELAAFISSIPAFQREGHFDSDLYRRLLASNGIDVVSFENRQREELLLAKLSDLILGGLGVSDIEALDFYNSRKEKIAIEAFLFKTSDFTSPVFTEEELLAYYEDNKDSYRTDALVKVEYLRFDPEDFSDDVSISEEELKSIYEMRIESFKMPERIAARHILFRVNENDGEDFIQKKEKELFDLRERLVKGADFELIAKEYSQCPSAENGGDLGVFSYETMVPSFSEAAFALKEGELSLPVRTPFGLHLIRLDKHYQAGTQSFEEVRDLLLAELKKEETRNLAYEKADEAYELTLNGADLKEAALLSKSGLKESAYFDARGPASGVSNRQLFARAAFSLIEGEISELLEIEDSLFLISLVDRKEPEIIEFSKVKDKIKTNLEGKAREKLARADADKALEALRNGGFPEPEFIKTALFGRGEEIPGLGSLPVLNDAVFALKKDSLIPEEVIELDESWAVFRIIERKLPDNKDFEKEKEEFKKEIRTHKQNRIYAQWMKNLRQSAKIYIEPVFKQRI